jgi:hypothetical protein
MKDIPTTIKEGLTFEGKLFAAPLYRGRYIGTERRHRPRWLEQNRDKWIHLEDIPQTTTPESQTNVRAAEAPSASPPFPDAGGERKDQDGSAATPPRASPPAEQSSACAALSLSEIAKTKIAIEGDVHVSTPCLASMLGVSERTLSRLLANGNGPPHVRITGSYYPLDKVQEWAAARGLMIKPLDDQ